MTDASHDARLWELLERIRVAERPHSEFEQAVTEHPECAEELRELWPVMQLADEFATDSFPAMAESPRPGDDPQPVPEIEDYELLEEIGRGGMGIVYRAFHRDLNREVAVKVCRSDLLESDQYSDRFRQEAAAIGQLDHPNIVRVHDVRLTDNQPCIVMQLIEGTSLSDLLRDGPINGRRAAEIVRDVAKAMTAAHQQGILHRDLKPSNILLDPSGKPFLTDFGLAKQFGPAHRSMPSMTQTGGVVGTPGYMAPEQILGSRSEVGIPTDVYGLGTILYALTTGRPPFQASQPLETLRLTVEQEPVAPRMLNPSIDPDLELIILKCLQKPTELRYASASRLASDLDAYLNDEAISARSSRFREVLARLLRETHHAAILENWGVLWMWHSVVLLLLCIITNLMKLNGLGDRTPYATLWTCGLTIWAITFWSLRRRSGPTTFVERQIAHVWGGSVLGSLFLFLLESILQLPVLSLSPVLGLISGSVFLAKAGILSGQFYVQAFALYGTSLLMAIMTRTDLPDVGISVFGVVSAFCFFVPGWKYQRLRSKQDL